ncbi:hypothetical protein YC2023_059257 [Brassica napus]
MTKAVSDCQSKRRATCRGIAGIYELITIYGEKLQNHIGNIERKRSYLTCQHSIIGDGLISISNVFVSVRQRHFQLSSIVLSNNSFWVSSEASLRVDLIMNLIKVHYEVKMYFYQNYGPDPATEVNRLVPQGPRHSMGFRSRVRIGFVALSRPLAHHRVSGFTNQQHFVSTLLVSKGFSFKEVKKQRKNTRSKELNQERYVWQL